ncbi:MAG: hypothetical protein V1837_02980 [Candidatus Woesearchaeota archaeon]
MNSKLIALEPRISTGWSLYGIITTNESQRQWIVGLSRPGSDVKSLGIDLVGVRIRNYNPNDRLYVPEEFLTDTKLRQLFVYVPDHDRLAYLHLSNKIIEQFKEVPLEGRVFDQWDNELSNRIVLCLVIPK